jgi:hypothetical protein
MDTAVTPPTAQATPPPSVQHDVQANTTLHNETSPGRMKIANSIQKLSQSHYW